MTSPEQDRNALTAKRLWWRKSIKNWSLPILCAALMVSIGEASGIDMRDVAAGIWGGFAALLGKLDVDTTDFSAGRFAANLLVGGSGGLLLTTLANRLGLIDRLFPDPPSFVFIDLERERAETMLEVELAATPALAGRDAEMALLRDLLSVPARERFKVQIIAGPTGYGKSRLAIEWLELAKQAKWDFGVIDPNQLGAVKGWKARRPTALVLDEADTEGLLLQTSSANPLEQLLLNLLAGSSKEKPVRILLVGQTTPWASGAAPEKLRPYMAKDVIAIDALEGEALEQLAHELAALRGADPANIIRESDGNPRHAILMAQMPDATTLESAFIEWTNRTFPELATGKNEVDRSLALGLIAAALVGPVPSTVITERYRDFRVNPLLRFFPRSGRRQLEQEIPKLRPGNLAQFIALRLLDDLSGKIRKQDALPMLLEHPEALERSLGEIWCDYPHWVEGLGGHPGEGSVQTDLAAQLRELQGAFDLRWAKRVEKAHQRMERWIGETGQDRPLMERHKLFNGIAMQADWRPFDTAVRLREAKAAVNATYYYGDSGAMATNAPAREAAFNAVERWGRRLDMLVATPTLGAHAEIRLEEAKATLNAISRYGRFGTISGSATGRETAFAALERWGRRFDFLATSEFASDPRIRLEEAKATINAIYYYGEVGASAADRSEREVAFDALERWGRRLDLLNATPTLSDDHAIRRAEAEAARLAIAFYGKAGASATHASEWEAAFAALERWGHRLAELVANPILASDPAIRLQEAKAVSQAIAYYGKFGASTLYAFEREAAFAALERWGHRMDELIAKPAFAADHAFRLEEANAAFHGTNGYGLAGVAASTKLERDTAFAAHERWGLRFDAILATPAFAFDTKIRLMEAEAAVNAVARYGQVVAAANAAAERDAALAALERWGCRFDAMLAVPSLASEHGVRLEESEATINAIACYARVAATADAASVRDAALAALERWGRRFDAILATPTLANNPAIRRSEAKAAFNAVKGYSLAAQVAITELERVEAFAGLERWGHRLDTMFATSALAADPVIRLEEAKAAVDAIKSYRKVSDDTGRAYWRGRVARVLQLFPLQSDISDVGSHENLSLAEQEAQGWPHGKVEWAEDGSVRTLIEPRLGTVRPDFTNESPAEDTAAATIAPDATVTSTERDGITVTLPDLPTSVTFTAPVLPPKPPAITPLASRNDPCPCGSGKRYKQCHGTIGNS